MTIVEIEDALLDTIVAMGVFATVQSAGRKSIPDVYAYPACFVFFDGDKGTGNTARAVDEVSFSISIQLQNLSAESEAAKNIYLLNDAVRDAIRGKTLGLANIQPFSCESRICSGYDDSDGVIEYTHVYTTILYGNPF